MQKCLDLLPADIIIKGKGESHVRFRTLEKCPLKRTLILSRRHSKVWWPVPFLAVAKFTSVATRYQFAADWTIGEHPKLRSEGSVSRRLWSFIRSASKLEAAPD